LKFDEDGGVAESPDIFRGVDAAASLKQATGAFFSHS
jgi:hypothetical protein